MSGISRVFIANRGEIAVRVIRACKDLGIECVLGASTADRSSLAAEMADRVICIGPPRPSDSYLKIGTLVHAAKKAGCDALHPGYGFLSERPELAEACVSNNIVFIGPPAECIRKMGNKLLARTLAAEGGIQVIPGSERLNDPEEAVRKAQEIEYPVMIKAAAGGGGRGIKVVWGPEELREVFYMASSEAGESFGDDTVYLEHYVPNARHVEVQIMGDQSGTLVHVGERDCSLQRRYQKIIEEAPAYALSAERREEIRGAALAIARAIRYENLGTVEFVFDQDRDRFYFLEMNTRIQVEHPVTEMVTGVDLVQEQVRIAAGSPLSISQSEIRTEGHAIECRITAECPEQNFRPCPGLIAEWVPPTGSDLRVDSHCYSGYFVPPFYDSLLGKVVARGRDRPHAIENMARALSEFSISGIETNIRFLLLILEHPDYRRGEVNTKWLEKMLASANGQAEQEVV